MTADEIRDWARNNQTTLAKLNTMDPGIANSLVAIFLALGEVAAQLAELNHHLHEGNYPVEVFGAVGEP